MAAPLFSALRSSSQVERPLLNFPSRNYHVELGAREKTLLEVDPALMKFKSYKNSVKVASKIGNVLTVVAVTACSYQLVVRAMTKN
ncbi:succinate dehydrogenase subunit [Carex rostrata]